MSRDLLQQRRRETIFNGKKQVRNRFFKFVHNRRRLKFETSIQTRELNSFTGNLSAELPLKGIVATKKCATKWQYCQALKNVWAISQISKRLKKAFGEVNYDQYVATCHYFTSY